jgi:hypothetical protein
MYAYVDLLPNPRWGRLVFAPAFRKFRRLNHVCFGIMARGMSAEKHVHWITSGENNENLFVGSLSHFARF